MIKLNESAHQKYIIDNVILNVRNNTSLNLKKDDVLYEIKSDVFGINLIEDNSLKSQFDMCDCMRKYSTINYTFLYDPKNMQILITSSSGTTYPDYDTKICIKYEYCNGCFRYYLMKIIFIIDIKKFINILS